MFLIYCIFDLHQSCFHAMLYLSAEFDIMVYLIVCQFINP